MAGGAINGAGAQASTSAPAASQPATPAVKAYKEDIVEGALAEFVQQSSQLGEIVSGHVGPSKNRLARSPDASHHRPNSSPLCARRSSPS